MDTFGLEQNSEIQGVFAKRALISLFINASLHYPANISGQGLWLTLLLRQGQREGQISEHIRVENLEATLSGEMKADILNILARAAQKGHRQLQPKPDVSPERMEGIVKAVLSTSRLCQSINNSDLHAMLAILQIYVQAAGYATGNDAKDTQNPEILALKASIKEIVYQSFEGDPQEYLLYFVDSLLFRMMPNRSYAGIRFQILLREMSWPW